MGTRLETRPRYTPTTTFETFPFPEPDNDQRLAIETAARTLVELRDGWLAASTSRTMTRLYNEWPTWLRHAHDALDGAVADAYGWPMDLPEDEVLARLLDLNSKRAANAADA